MVALVSMLLLLIIRMQEDNHNLLIVLFLFHCLVCISWPPVVIQLQIEMLMPTEDLAWVMCQEMTRLFLLGEIQTWIKDLIVLQRQHDSM